MLKSFKMFITESLREREHRPSEKLTQIRQIFRNTPELSEVGTIEQYRDWLDFIFPNSIVKDIVYHDTRSEEIEDSKLRPSREGVYGEGIYVQTKQEFTGTFGSKTLSLIIDTKKPFPFHIGGEPNPIWKRIIDKHAKTKKYYFADTAKEEFRESIIDNGYDAIRTTEGAGNTYYILFNPEQVHILGSKDDIEGFKNFTLGLESSIWSKNK